MQSSLERDRLRIASSDNLGPWFGGRKPAHKLGCSCVDLRLWLQAGVQRSHWRVEEITSSIGTVCSKRPASTRSDSLASAIASVGSWVTRIVVCLELLL